MHGAGRLLSFSSLARRLTEIYSFIVIKPSRQRRAAQAYPRNIR
jgi:hypothetical protein